jgi:YD repeat-containing protein
MIAYWLFPGRMPQKFEMAAFEDFIDAMSVPGATTSGFMRLSLRYHLKSLKPSNCKSNVALGWTLDYGGMLSRTIYDRADEAGYFETYSSSSYSGIGSSEELNRLAKVTDGSDSEYDIFNYNLNSGEAGEFIVTSWYYLEYTFAQLGRKSINIAKGTNGSSFDITNDKGVLYRFGGDGKTIRSFSPDNYGYPSSWLLSQVVFPNNKTIDFTYQSTPRYIVDNVPGRLTIFYDDKQTSSSGGGVFSGPGACVEGVMPQYSTSSPVYHVEYEENNIKEINFPNGKIVFDLSSDQKIITGVKVYNLGKLIQEYQFGLSSGLAMGDMKFLDKVVVKDKNSNTVNEYNFQYTNPAYINSGAGTDYWGYYNGTVYRSFPAGIYNYTYYNPGQQIGSWYVGGPGQAKDATNDCITNTLKKIIYPTKGETEFQYELNQLTPTVFGDGPRIRKIISRADNNSTIIKSFLYETPPDQYVPSLEDFCSARFDITMCNLGDASSPIRTTTRMYDADITNRIAASLAQCHYNKVTEFTENAAGSSIGRNVYYFMHNKHVPAYKYNPAGGPYYVIYQYRGWGNDLLYKKESYKADETTPVAVDIYDYTYQYDQESYKNSVITKLTDYPYRFFTNPPPDPSDMDILMREYLLNSPEYRPSPSVLTDVYAFYNYDIVTGRIELQSETHSETTPNGTISTFRQYQYNGTQPYFPSRVITSKSDGTKNLIDKTYPYDYGTTEPYHSMTARNIIAPTIQETLSTQKGAGTPIVLKANKTDYLNWGNNIIQPVTIQEATGASALSNLETRVQFYGYDDKGNVTAAAKAYDVQKVYLWGYNKSYVVAEVIGASLSSVLSTPNLNMAVIENATGTYTDAQVRAELSKIRNNLTSAHLITYTYDPLVGITSQTDANNRTTYYEYDASGRLKSIKDQDGNILRRFDYNYAQ